MSMQEFAVIECAIPERSLKEVVPEEFHNLLHIINKYGVSLEDVATGLRYEDFESVMLDNMDFEERAEMDDDALIDIAIDIEGTYNKLCEAFAVSIPGLWLELISPAEDADLDDDYLWTTPLVLSRKLQKLNARIETWVEYG